MIGIADIKIIFKSSESTKGLDFVVESKEDLRSALNNLGFSDRDFIKIWNRVKKEYQGNDFSDLVRLALGVAGESGKPQPSNVGDRSSALDRLF